jgi:hypothetical protein
MRASPTLAGIQTAFNRKQVYDENCRRVSVQRWVGLVMFRLMFGGNPDSFWELLDARSACRPGLVEVARINEIVISAPQNLHRMFVKAVATNKQPRALWNVMASPHAGGTLDKWGFDSMDRRVQYPHALNSWVLAEHQYKETVAAVSLPGISPQSLSEPGLYPCPSNNFNKFFMDASSCDSEDERDDSPLCIESHSI